MKKQGVLVQVKGWGKIIASVKTPLGYAVFATLAGLLILLASRFFSNPATQNLLIIAGLILVFLSIVYVFIMSARQPEALKGERVAHKIKEDNPRSQEIPAGITKNRGLTVQQSIADLGITRIGFFEDFVELFPGYIESSSTLITMFIHSRRWRENNNSALNKFLLKDRSKIVVLLPDIKNYQLLSEIKKHFDDGSHLEFFISDAYRYYFQLKTRFPEKVDVRCFSLYPTYSLYKFDDVAIIAMYTNTTKRRSVPTFEVSSKGEIWNFLGDDLDLLLNSCESLSIDEVHEYSDLNTSTGESHA